MLTIPNIVTLLRVFSIPVFVLSLIYGQVESAFAVFLFAALSDALDGFLARRLNQVSRLGILMDPLADKALINSGFFLLTYYNKVIPAWLTVLVLSRDLFLLFGTWLLSVFGKLDRVRPNLMGKITAFMQFLTLFWVLFSLSFHIKLSWITESLFFLTGIFTVLSAVIYAVKGILELSSE